MKYLILVGDGMGDYPIPELEGSTVLQWARTPNMDKLARSGEMGLAQTIPTGMEAGSDVANMSIIGYDPAVYHTGRSPIEAAAMGVDLKPGEIAFRCNLVTLDHQDGKTVLADYCAGHINSKSASELISALNQEVASKFGIKFYPGVSYRHLLIWPQGPLAAETRPPHNHTGQPVDVFLPTEGDLGLVSDVIRASWPVMQNHAANLRLRKMDQPGANSIWLWGQGTKPSFPTMNQRFGIGGTMVSAVDLLKGLGVLAGLEAVEVPGANGWLDTNYEGKVEAAMQGLEKNDLAFVHIEAPDEAGHSGKLELKLEAIELFDEKVVGPALEGISQMGPHRVMLVTDHYTPLMVKTHTPEPVPYVIWDSEREVSGGNYFCEAHAKRTGNPVIPAHTLINRLLERS
jgi:2,3-bisphosphoglycerate-independent phosphoglycerate mutase